MISPDDVGDGDGVANRTDRDAVPDSLGSGDCDALLPPLPVVGVPWVFFAASAASLVGGVSIGLKISSLRLQWWVAYFLAFSTAIDPPTPPAIAATITIHTSARERKKVGFRSPSSLFCLSSFECAISGGTGGLVL